MALETNAFTTYLAKGNREDLTDVIYRISPTDTPFLSGIDKENATATYHEWQTQALAAVSSTNAQIEGDAATADAATATVRLGNYTQIARKIPRVTGTQQAVDHAGRGSEMAYQEMLKGLELKRDIETSLLASTTGSTSGSSSGIRRIGGYNAWITTNSTFQSTGADATGDGTNFRDDAGAAQLVAFTEPMLKSVLQQCWTAGGKPDTIMAGGFNKQQFSLFNGRASPIEDAKSKKITAAVDAYESDFGTLKVVPNRFSRTRDVLVIQMDMWAIAYLNGRRMVSEELGKTGDTQWRQIIAEYTLEARNEASSGGIYDLTSS